MSLTMGLICFGCTEKAEELIADVEKMGELLEDAMFFLDNGEIDVDKMLAWIERHRKHCIGFEVM